MTTEGAIDGGLLTGHRGLVLGVSSEDSVGFHTARQLRALGADVAVSSLRDSPRSRRAAISPDGRLASMGRDSAHPALFWAACIPIASSCGTITTSDGVEVCRNGARDRRPCGLAG